RQRGYIGEDEKGEERVYSARFGGVMPVVWTVAGGLLMGKAEHGRGAVADLVVYDRMEKWEKIRQGGVFVVFQWLVAFRSCVVVGREESRRGGWWWVVLAGSGKRGREGVVRRLG
ncbi:hypothetical protein HAX54_012777, partial [Datura stramonium]|nr:hypothetical protein [Datura stramonium]